MQFRPCLSRSAPFPSIRGPPAAAWSTSNSGQLLTTAWSINGAACQGLNVGLVIRLVTSTIDVHLVISMIDVHLVTRDGMGKAGLSHQHDRQESRLEWGWRGVPAAPIERSRQTG